MPQPSPTVASHPRIPFTPSIHIPVFFHTALAAPRLGFSSLLSQLRFASCCFSTPPLRSPGSGLVPVGVDAGGSGLFRVGFLGHWCAGIQDPRAPSLGCSRIHGTWSATRFSFSIIHLSLLLLSGLEVGFVPLRVTCSTHFLLELLR